MKPILIPTTKEFRPVWLIIRANVRYWEDATVNGTEDTDGSLIPLRDGNEWCPIINLDTGRIAGWPIGITASIHYKVCDAGKYWLKDADGNRAQYQGDYVPEFLDGSGDYLIMEIDAVGEIQGWKTPDIDPARWEFV